MEDKKLIIRKMFELLKLARQHNNTKRFEYVVEAKEEYVIETFDK